ncbi:MAG: MBL fold metallo-hydrolase [Oscillospiraceae bacterium]|nr:MBL fold metallo-hydrolase [Oscillospiraceae bacterium]
MRVKFLGHSGFLVETEKTRLLFDHYTGPLPEKTEKPLYVFVSHGHHDHFNPAVFSLDAVFILSDDIALHRTDAIFVPPDAERDVDDLHIRTLRSTDQGVAFLVTVDGHTLYHAGDLHLWLWDEEDTPAEAEAMTLAYRTEMEKLRGVHIEAAFLPLDSRQSPEQYWLGLDYAARTLDIEHIFPMHCWGQYGIIAPLRAKEYGAKIADIHEEGQEFLL